MTVDVLTPNLDVISQEYVLVQAWKKTASYIRYHNWYSDTLELDRTAVNLPDFIESLAKELSLPDSWKSDPLRIVPAPKSQQWQVDPNTNLWKPVQKVKAGNNLRPLAHVSIRDQVAATAIMMCLADRIETLQGDPRLPIKDAENRKRVVSYGNRLFCEIKGNELHHRWGSAKLYRKYFQDYRSFLERPELVAENNNSNKDTRIVVIHTDLRQFYDRVRPRLLREKIKSIMKPGDDRRFFSLLRCIFNWQWSPKDSQNVTDYVKQTGLSDFSNVAIPQGLVAAGFFANIVLLDFDKTLQSMISSEIDQGIILEDFCRYVDDFRIVLKVNAKLSLLKIEETVCLWLQKLLDEQAIGLSLKKEKTRAALFKGNERLLVRQSRKMKRIQSAVSGGFDAIGGIEILDAIQGLIRSQERYTEKRINGQGWGLSPIPDVRDETVARFAAARYRSTYRSLRPLLPDVTVDQPDKQEVEGEKIIDYGRFSRTRAELDDDVRAFALGLIENWVNDPSNVRLLRIGLDLWPAGEVIKRVLDLLRPFTEKGGLKGPPRRVAWYCLSEIFRAGALETGFVEDNESMPTGIDIVAYRKVLRKEAIRLTSRPAQTLPWYLKQQVLLFLAINDSDQAPIHRTGNNPETKHYRELIRFLKGDVIALKSRDYATLSILARRSFRDSEAAIQLTNGLISPHRFEQIARRDPSFALELIENNPELATIASPKIRDDLCLSETEPEEDWTTLSAVVLQNTHPNPLRNEIALLSFALAFLRDVVTMDFRSITPSNVQLMMKEENGKTLEIDEIKIFPSRVSSSRSIYRPPSWCPSEERWRFQLGYLLRFILTAKQDFTKVVRPFHKKEKIGVYRVPESHWFQRLYGLYHGHSAFGDDWLPISDWVERLLLSLLSWPGCKTSDILCNFENIQSVSDIIKRRLTVLSKKQGVSKNLLILPIKAPRIDHSSRRPLRICIVQSVIPSPDDFQLSDLTLSNPIIRRRHRNHLSSALSAIESMLNLRETHKCQAGRLDWLIFPELSVHPRDVNTHLIPFARAHKTIILAGMTYQRLLDHQPLINSAIWIIPALSDMQGLQIRIYRQGKEHLAPNEQQLNSEASVLQSFRPCQWLIGYDWAGDPKDDPLWLTASICYDATDLCLAADLRNQSDVFAIPALNRDVSTFDQMALALHYHMFQMVIVVNNGTFGGSNAYVPYREDYRRQVIHLHGQPQASVAFLEIDDIASYMRRRTEAMNQLPTTNPRCATTWKYPPAGL